MCVSISGTMDSSHFTSRLTFRLSRRRRSVENLSFTAYCIRRSPLSILNSRRRKMSVHRLRILKRKIEFKNLKLYIENKSIIEENEKLRKKAALLHLENLALQSQLQINSPIQLSLLSNQVK